MQATALRDIRAALFIVPASILSAFIHLIHSLQNDSGIPERFGEGLNYV